MRIGEIVEQARQGSRPLGVDARNDVRLLVSEAVGRPVSWVLAHPEAALSAAEMDWLTLALTRYRDGEALPYLLGWWEFYGRRFQVSPSVLIPRPETESLVDRVLRFLHEDDSRRKIADVGTGSGCIAVTLAAEVPDGRVLAVDVSHSALRLARANAQIHGVEAGVAFLQGDLLTATHGEWDVIVANLPYIPIGRLAHLATAQREPRLALDGGEDGLAVLRRFASGLPRCLRPGGLAVLEIDDGQGTEMTACVKAALPEADVRVEPDLAGRERLLLVSRPMRA